MHEQLDELLEQLCPSEDYEAAVHYFSHFTHDIPLLIERHLDALAGGFDYSSCRYPDRSKPPQQKGVLLITDVTFGAPDSDSYSEVLMSFSDFLGWLRAIARWWSKVNPADEKGLEHLFHERDLAYTESEVGPPFDKGAVWWRKIEEQRVMARTTCQNYVSSPQWKYASDYFRDVSDAAFPAWLRTLSQGEELPSHWFQAKCLPTGDLKIFRPSWNDEPEQYVEITRSELEMVLSELVEAFAKRRPNRAEEAQRLLGQIKSRS